MGPLAYAVIAVDGFAWAHRNKQLLLLLRADYAYLSSTYVDKDQYEGQYLPGAVG